MFWSSDGGSDKDKKEEPANADQQASSDDQKPPITLGGVLRGAKDQVSNAAQSITSTVGGWTGIPENDVRVLLLGGTMAVGMVWSYSMYQRYLSRVCTSLDIPKDNYHRRVLYGKVTSVGDGDNFHFYHMPGGVFGGWGWLREIPEINQFKKLKDQTIHVRICGVDAPERAHFGKPAQPYGDEALDWLRKYILGRRVWIKPMHMDQYNRSVSKAWVWKWTGMKDVGAEMIKAGMAGIYEAKVGAEFDGQEEHYKRLESWAKWWHRGMWSLPKSKQQTAREYKNKYNTK